MRSILIALPLYVNCSHVDIRDYLKRLHFVYIEGLGYQVNRHLAHAELCVRKMCTPEWRQKKTQPLIYKGCGVVVTVGLEPTTPSM